MWYLPDADDAHATARHDSSATAPTHECSEPTTNENVAAQVKPAAALPAVHVKDFPTKFKGLEESSPNCIATLLSEPSPPFVLDDTSLAAMSHEAAIKQASSARRLEKELPIAALGSSYLIVLALVAVAGLIMPLAIFAIMAPAPETSIDPAAPLRMTHAWTWPMVPPRRIAPRADGTAPKAEEAMPARSQLPPLNFGDLEGGMYGLYTSNPWLVWHLSDGMGGAFSMADASAAEEHAEETTLATDGVPALHEWHRWPMTVPPLLACEPFEWHCWPMPPEQDRAWAEAYEQSRASGRAKPTAEPTAAAPSTRMFTWKGVGLAVFTLMPWYDLCSMA